MSRFFYNLLLLLLLPRAMVHLLWRSRRQPEYLRHWGERFGHYTACEVAPRLWIHAVSVGETRAAQPLIALLRQQFPGYRILFTHTTPTGRTTSTSLFGGDVDRVYLPYDTPGAVRRFLRHFRPAIGIVMETELWPNLVHACAAQRIPLLLVNARLSEKSARAYARLPKLTRQMLTELSVVAAQTEADAARLTVLGAVKVQVLGNLKFDIEPTPGQLDLGARLRQRIDANGRRQVLLAASTREGEEALLLDALAARPITGLLLVIVPRHPQRFDAVAELVGSRGMELQRRSDEQAIDSNTQVWLGDSMGELFAYYAAADVAFVGGSLLDFGSQNLIEPCAIGTPVLLGPSTYNFAQAAEDATAAGAVLPVRDADELIATAQSLLADPARRTQMAAAGRAFSARHRGAAARTVALISGFIAPTQAER